MHSKAKHGERSQPIGQGSGFFGLFGLARGYQPNKRKRRPSADSLEYAAIKEMQGKRSSSSEESSVPGGGLLDESVSL